MNLLNFFKSYPDSQLLNYAHLAVLAHKKGNLNGKTLRVP